MTTRSRTYTEPLTGPEEGHGTRWALNQSALVEVRQALKAADVDDRIRSTATTIYPALIEAELTAVTGVGTHERTESRTAQRNGSRPRTLSTTAGDLELRIPKLRAGSFFPSLLELPLAAGAPPADRPGPVRRGHGGLSARRVHPQGRRPGPRTGRGHRHLQVRGLP